MVFAFGYTAFLRKWRERPIKAIARQKDPKWLSLGVNFKAQTQTKNNSDHGLVCLYGLYNYLAKICSGKEMTRFKKNGENGKF